LVLQGCKDMPDFPWVKPEEFIHHCGLDIVAIDHNTAIRRWVELGCLDIIYKVSNNNTLIFRRRGVCNMPGIDEGIDGTHPTPPQHFFRAISSQRTAVRQEKKAREQAQEVTREASPFPSMAPCPLSLLSYHSTPAADGDCSSSNIEVSEVMDHCDLTRSARGSHLSSRSTRR